jgi:hypothetical protein
MLLVVLGTVTARAVVDEVVSCCCLWNSLWNCLAILVTYCGL